MSTTPINILHLEDEAMDVFLVKKILDRSKLLYNATVVSDKESFVNALHTDKFDVIIADHSLPQFTAMDALRILKERKIDIPFILVTGTVSEEFSVNAMKEGAWDYILKDRLQRLPSAVQSALEKYKVDQERKKYLEQIIKNESLMKEAERMARFGSWHVDFVTGNTAWSDEKYRIMGYEPGEVPPTFNSFMDRIHPDDVTFVKHIHDHAYQHLNSLKYECRVISKENSTKHIYAEVVIRRDTDNNITALTGFIHDITESKDAKQKLEESEKKYQYLFTHSPMPAWVVDTNSFAFLDVNIAAINHYGYSHGEFMKMTALDIRPEGEQQAFIDYVQHIGNMGGKNTTDKHVFNHVKKDGAMIKVEVNTGSVVYDQKHAYMMLLTDIT